MPERSKIKNDDRVALFKDSAASSCTERTKFVSKFISFEDLRKSLTKNNEFLKFKIYFFLFDTTK